MWAEGGRKKEEEQEERGGFIDNRLVRGERRRGKEQRPRSGRRRLS